MSPPARRSDCAPYCSHQPRRQFLTKRASKKQGRKAMQSEARSLPRGGILISCFNMAMVQNDTEKIRYVKSTSSFLISTKKGVPGSAPGCRPGNREKLSSTQAEPVQAIQSAVAYFPSISCTTSWRRSRYKRELNFTEMSELSGICIQ